MLILQSTYSRWDQHLLWTSSAVLVQTLYSPHFWGSNHRYLKAWASNKLRNAYGGGLKATELAFRILFVLSLPSQAWQTYTVYRRAWTDLQSPTTLQLIQHVTCVAGKCHRPGVSGSTKELKSLFVRAKKGLREEQRIVVYTCLRKVWIRNVRGIWKLVWKWTTLATSLQAGLLQSQFGQSWDSYSAFNWW